MAKVKKKRLCTIPLKRGSCSPSCAFFLSTVAQSIFRFGRSLRWRVCNWGSESFSDNNVPSSSPPCFLVTKNISSKLLHSSIFTSWSFTRLLATSTDERYSSSLHFLTYISLKFCMWIEVDGSWSAHNFFTWIPLKSNVPNLGRATYKRQILI